MVSELLRSKMGLFVVWEVRVSENRRPTPPIEQVDLGVPYFQTHPRDMICPDYLQKAVDFSTQWCSPNGSHGKKKHLGSIAYPWLMWNLSLRLWCIGASVLKMFSSSSSFFVFFFFSSCFLFFLCLAVFFFVCLVSFLLPLPGVLPSLVLGLIGPTWPLLVLVLLVLLVLLFFLFLLFSCSSCSCSSSSCCCCCSCYCSCSCFVLNCVG